jgi:hypothetical protein
MGKKLALPSPHKIKMKNAKIIRFFCPNYKIAHKIVVAYRTTKLYKLGKLITVWGKIHLKITIAKGTLIIVIIIAVLVSGGVSAGITMMSAGSQGPKGEPGATGSVGPPGPTGANGATGAAGSQGTQGVTGATGATGATGPAGTQVPPGPQGPYLPDYDSGWVDISGKTGQYFIVTHNLNYNDYLVDIVGKTTAGGSIQQKYLGLSGYVPGWNKTYGAGSVDYGESVVLTGDGGYAVAGYTNSYGAGGFDAYLVKTDASGNVQWNKTYGGPNNDYGVTVALTGDGGYIIAGQTESYGAGLTDFYLVRTDAGGNQVWSKTYGGSNNDYGYYVALTADGGYIVEGYTSSFGAGGIDVFLVKTDANGIVQWSRTYGGPGNDYGYYAVQTADGGYTLVGGSDSYGSGNFDVYLVKTDSSGTMQWNKTYGGANVDFGRSLVKTNDGGYALAGYTTSSGAGSYDVYLVKTDVNGNYLWNKTYGGPNDDRGYAIVQTADAGYAIVGHTGSFGSGGVSDIYLVKTDAFGNLQWSRTYGGTGYDIGYSFTLTADGGYAIAGSTYSYGAGNYDMYLVKTEVQGEFGVARIDSSINTLTLYRGANDVYWNYLRVRIWKID